MAEMKVTTDSILKFLQDSVESKRMMNPELWINAAFKLNTLLGIEHLDLETKRRRVAQMKLELMKGQEKRNVSATELEVEASEEYMQMRLQEHKVDRIEEFIRLGKIQARTAAGL